MDPRTHFADRRRTWEVGPPAAGDVEPLRERYRFGLELTRPPAFAVERRRGWTETADSPSYDPELDPWDIRRVPRLERVQWADWDRSGRLLAATTTGRIEVRREPWGEADTDWSFDLGDDRPAPAEPPSIARRWIE